MLIEAIRHGEFEDVQAVIRDGVDLDESDDEGNTGLHHAVQSGSPDLAALLLMQGADYKKANGEGVGPLSPAFVEPERLHVIKQHYLRLPAQNGDRPVPSSEMGRDLLDNLKAKGFVKIPGLVGEQSLEILRRDFARFIADVDRRLAKGEGHYRHYDEEDGYRPKEQYYVTNNAYRFSDELVRITASDLICELADCYLGKPAHLRRALAMRYQTVRRPFFSLRRIRTKQFKWHHDMEDKLLKVMILLTDVGVKDQYMRYVVGSHTLFHPYERFHTNVLEPEYCKEMTGVRKLEIASAIGKAGDAFVFDTNGMHAARRSSGRVRDAFFLGFTANKDNHWGADISDEARRTIVQKAPSYFGVNPFDRMMSVPKKWEVPENFERKRTTWVGHLYRPELWVW